MGCRENDYAVWAILGQDDVPVLCTRKEANEWFWSKDRKRSQIKSDQLAAPKDIDLVGEIQEIRDAPEAFNAAVEAWEMTGLKTAG
jgi:hypothetical protein